MSFVVTPPAAAAVPVAGGAPGALFPVHRIYCVGRNYAAHAREMGKDPDKEPPFFFMKPADAVLPVAEPGPGGVLVKTLYLSLDPAMRGWMNEGKSYIPPVGIGEVGTDEDRYLDAVGTHQSLDLGGDRQPSAPAREWVGQYGQRTDGHQISLPGLHTPAGSSTAFTALSTATPRSPISADIHGRWSRPTA